MLLKNQCDNDEIKKKLKNKLMHFPSGPVVKNLPSNAGDVGSTPGQGTKIPNAVGQLSWVPQLLSPRASTREAVCRNYRAHTLWSLSVITTERKPTCHN